MVRPGRPCLLEGERLMRHMRHVFVALLALTCLGLACGSTPTASPSSPLPPAAPPAPEPSAFDQGVTTFGFFPSPPELTLESVLKHYDDLGQHADFVLLQNNIPWQAASQGYVTEPQALTDLHNQVILARQQDLDVIFVVDPLNGLNRREFLGLPPGWEASFANPAVRTAFRNHALWLVDTFHPRYLGLASEINTYANARPEDFEHFLSLYREVYREIRSRSPATEVFVTFQWEDLNNLFPGANEERQPYKIDWEQIEAFEPELDVWVISSYPYIAFASGADIPSDYYTPLLSRTDKPLAVAEGGYSSEPVGPFLGTAQDQVDYLSAIEMQIGGRLRFWVYLALSDFDLDSYADVLRAHGLSEADVTTLALFTSVGLQHIDGTPKSALARWDELRSEHRR
jgi:hypothetical protein